MHPRLVHGKTRKVRTAKAVEARKKKTNPAQDWERYSRGISIASNAHTQKKKKEMNGRVQKERMLNKGMGRPSPHEEKAFREKGPGPTRGLVVKRNGGKKALLGLHGGLALRCRVVLLWLGCDAAGSGGKQLTVGRSWKISAIIFDLYTPSLRGGGLQGKAKLCRFKRRF